VGYRYLDDLATADIAFEATGEDVEQVFVAAAEATMNVMVEELQSIEARVERIIEKEDAELDMLLFDMLQEIVYYKDAEQLLLRIRELAITERKGAYLLRARAVGERLDPRRHEQRADVKAVTLHRFSLQEADGLWKALVILDV
jgi:SHS2 domain-containing protein